MAVHNHCIIDKEGALPLLPQVEAAKPYSQVNGPFPKGHEGTLLQAKERLGRLYAGDPHSKFGKWLSEITSPEPDERFLPWDGPDLARQQLQEHTANSPVWVHLEKWHEKCAQYEDAARKAVAHFEKRALELTCLERAYQGYGPGTEGITSHFTLSVLRDAIALWDGRPADQWTSTITRTSGKDSEFFGLNINQTQIAVGKYEQMREAGIIYETLYNEACRSQDVFNVYKIYSELKVEEKEIEEVLKGMDLEEIMARKCWACAIIEQSQTVSD
jgi:hypothetical protein